MEITKYQNILLIVYRLLLLMTYICLSHAKCELHKSTVSCYGSKWRQDLLPIDNHLIVSLIISNCSDGITSSSQEIPEESDLTMDIEFIKLFFRLKYLSITKCEAVKWSTLHISSNSLEHLDLSHNGIINDDKTDDNTNSVTKIFVNAPHLRTVNLTNNHLTDLPMSWFKCINKIEILLLDSNHIRGLNPQLSKCFPKLKQLSLRHNYFTKLLTNPSPKSDKTKIPKTKSQLPFQSINANFLFPNNSHLPSSSDTKLRHYPNYLGDKDLTSNFDGVIPKFVKLESLDLSHNHISAINQLPLMNLTHLRTLNLSYNKFKSPSKLLSSSNDAYVDLSSCDIGTAPFYIARSVLLQDNQIGGLKSLDLSHNAGLTRIQKCWTYGIDQLVSFKISNCSISKIEESVFDEMSRLIDLDLSHNQLDRLPSELSNIASQLQHLNLAFNKFNQIFSAGLIKMTNLRTLNLSHNAFQSLLTSQIAASKQSNSIQTIFSNQHPINANQPTGLLSQMLYLTNLDLSYNKLTQISAKHELPPSLYHPGLLKQLNLYGNPQLSQFLDFDSRSITLSLTHLNISPTSPLLCDCSTLEFIKWVQLRYIKVTGYCRYPDHLKSRSISSPSLLKYVDKKCQSKPQSNTNHVLPMDSMIRLMIYSNANITNSDTTSSDHSSSSSSSSDSNFRSPNVASSKSNNNNLQSWVLKNSKLSLRCEFYSSLSNQIFSIPTIEWRRDVVTQFHPLSPQYRLENSRLPLPRKRKLSNDDNNQYNKRQSRKYQQQQQKTQPRNTIKNEILTKYNSGINIETIGPISAAFDAGDKFDKASIERLLNATPDKYKYSQGQPFKYISLIHLESNLIYDAAKYYCLINRLPTNDYFSMTGRHRLVSSKLEIQVFVPPQFVITPPKLLSTIEGEMAEIECRARGYPPPITSLGRAVESTDSNNQTSFTNEQRFPAAAGRRILLYKDDDGAFYISDVRLEDSGVYSCTSRNPVATITASFKLNVQVRASIIKKPKKQIYVELGRPLIIRYQIRGVPSPRVSWMKDGHVIDETNERFHFSADRFMLIIELTAASDSGLYQISVLNALGGDNTEVAVRVYSGPYDAAKNDNSKSANPTSSWLNDYWLSAIIIIAVLSMLVTSILWIFIFFCCTKRILRNSNNKQRKALMYNYNSQHQPLQHQSTTNVTKPQHYLHQSSHSLCSAPLGIGGGPGGISGNAIPLSLTTSTIVRHSDTTHDFIQAAPSTTAFDSGIDSATHNDTITLNGSDISSVYQCCRRPTKLQLLPTSAQQPPPPSSTNNLFLSSSASPETKHHNYLSRPVLSHHQSLFFTNNHNMVT